MDLAECMARALAVEGACLAANRHSTPPPGRLRETWPDYYFEACEILDRLGNGDVRTPALMDEIESARAQLARRRGHPGLVREVPPLASRRSGEMFQPRLFLPR